MYRYRIAASIRKIAGPLSELELENGYSVTAVTRADADRIARWIDDCRARSVPVGMRGTAYLFTSVAVVAELVPGLADVAVSS